MTDDWARSGHGEHYIVEISLIVQFGSWRSLRIWCQRSAHSPSEMAKIKFRPPTNLVELQQYQAFGEG